MPFFSLSLSLSISNFVVLFIVYYKFLWFSGLRRILKQQNKLFNLLRSVFFSLHHRQDDIILIIRYCIFIYIATFNETYFVMPSSNSCQFSQPDLSQIERKLYWASAICEQIIKYSMQWLEKLNRFTSFHNPIGLHSVQIPNSKYRPPSRHTIFFSLHFFFSYFYFSPIFQFFFIILCNQHGIGSATSTCVYYADNYINWS